MLKRQETVLSSSSRRETVPEKNHHHAKAIGCLAGVLQLVSKYQNRHRNRITFGRKQGKNSEEVPTSAIKAAKPSVPVENRATPSAASMTITMRFDHKKKKGNGRGGEKICDFRRRFSCEVPRSPTLPPEIRRSNSVNSPENFRTSTPPPPALVARLMGLDEIPSAESAIAEKRRKLLGALEKCDEDLKAIKKIIESLRSAEPERHRSPPPPPVSVEGNASLGGVRKCIGRRNDEDQYDVSGYDGDGCGSGGGGEDIMRNVKWCSEFNGGGGEDIMRNMKWCCSEFNGGEQRSPISVFDDFTRSPLNNSWFSKRHITDGRRMVQQQQQKLQPMRTNPRVVRRDVDDFGMMYETEMESLYLRSGKATMNMIESVGEVCRDIAWGEKREVGRIGLVLQDYIFKDLIEEIVKELGEYCSGCMLYYSLPLEACRRRLPF